MTKKYTLLEKAFILKKTPMFSLLEIDLLLPIADKMHLLSLFSSEIIFDEGEQANSMYFIESGEVTIDSIDTPQKISLQTGEVFGDESLFSGKPRGYKATTSKNPVTLFSLSRADLLAIINEYPKVATGFLETYAKTITFRKR